MKTGLVMRLGPCATLAACAIEPPPPELHGVEPARAPAHVETAVTVLGEHFAARVRADLDDPEASDVDARFALAIGHGGQAASDDGWVDLLDVERIDDQRLRARIPAGAATGLLDLRLIDPRGREARLSGALELYEVECAANLSCRDDLFCNGDEECVAGACRAGAAPCADDGLPCTVMCDEAAQACNVVDEDACLIDGACLLAGAADPTRPCRTCDPQTSRTEWTADDEGACDDGLFCNGPETCSAGACVPAGVDPCAGDGLSCTNGCDEAADACTVDASTCLIDGACRAAGEVDPANPCRECVPTTGQTAWTADDANACDDGLFCNGPDACAGGACLSGPAPCGDDGLSCTIPCDEATGSCDVLLAGFCAIDGSCHPANAANPADPCQVCDPSRSPVAWTDADGAACDDGDACTFPDACSAGACVGPLGCVGNTPPAAAFSVMPRAGTTSTAYGVDASMSVDLEDPLTALTFRWDWEGDGSWDTPFSTSPTASTTYGPPFGERAIVLQVQDTGLLSGYATHSVVVSPNADLVTVTTAIDEDDAGASPASPGGSGLSLREAIQYVGATAGAQTIGFAGPMTLAILSALPDLLEANEQILGEAGVIVDGAALPPGQDCLSLAGTSQRLVGLEIRGCPGFAVSLSGNGVQVVDCVIYANLGGLVVADTATIGPGNVITGNLGAAIEANAAATVRGNHIAANGADGIVVNGASGVEVYDNVLFANAGHGLRFLPDSNAARVDNNTLSCNVGGGVFLADGTQTHRVRNNLFTSNNGPGLDAGDAAFSALARNDYYGNLGGACLGAGCAAQTDAFVLQPGYLDEAAGDLRLFATSPVIGLGSVLGIDLNGPEAALFNGAAPELGAWEAPDPY